MAKRVKIDSLKRESGLLVDQDGARILPLVLQQCIVQFLGPTDLRSLVAVCGKLKPLAVNAVRRMTVSLVKQTAQWCSSVTPKNPHRENMTRCVINYFQQPANVLTKELCVANAYLRETVVCCMCVDDDRRKTVHSFLGELSLWMKSDGFSHLLLDGEYVTGVRMMCAHWPLREW